MAKNIIKTTECLWSVSSSFDLADSPNPKDVQFVNMQQRKAAYIHIWEWVSWIKYIFASKMHPSTACTSHLSHHFRSSHSVLPRSPPVPPFCITCPFPFPTYCPVSTFPHQPCSTLYMPAFSPQSIARLSVLLHALPSSHLSLHLQPEAITMKSGACAGLRNHHICHF